MLERTRSLYILDPNEQKILAEIRKNFDYYHLMDHQANRHHSLQSAGRQQRRDDPPVRQNYYG